MPSVSGGISLVLKPRSPARIVLHIMRNTREMPSWVADAIYDALDRFMEDPQWERRLETAMGSGSSDEEKALRFVEVVVSESGITEGEVREACSRATLLRFPTLPVSRPVR